MATKYLAWHFAFRPSGGLDDGRLEMLTVYVRKYPWYLIITEGIGERRHAHVLIATKAGLIRSNLITQILSVFSTKFAEKSGLTLSPEERKAFKCRNFNNRANPCIWYNWQVVDEYLEKDSYKIIVAQHLPPKEERDEFAKLYFPK